MSRLLACAFVLIGCGPASSSDAGTDAPLTDAPLTLDAPVAADVPTDAPAGATAVALTYRAGTGTLDRAFFGYHRTAGTIDGLYFELSRGADDACPSATSPVPQQVVTVDGIPWDGATLPVTRTQADGVTVAFFDFEGTFRTEVAPAMASAASVEVHTVEPAAGTATATVGFTFDADGTAAGTLSAMHCDSLDTAD